MSLRKGNTLISGVGIDGVSPTASVTKSGDVATISITDKNGTTTATISDGSAPTRVTSQTATYTIANLEGNYAYELGEITSLTITASTASDIESIIYFESGSTATSVSFPETITHLGDAPTMTLASNVNTGTCETSKNYIISILNNIAIWKAY